MNGENRILVTGGAGFIGGRLVEVLVSQGFRVCVATSDFSHCARVASLPVELVKANLGDYDALSRAVAGCDVVFHAAYRFGGAPEEERRMNLDGTRALAEAFLKNGGRRFIHISSIMAYGEPCDGEITEESPQRPTREAYGNIKRQIERTLLELHRTRGLGVTILQPTIVYGPHGYFFTIRPLEELRSSRIALPVGGLCNAVYVDDVVSAAVLAAEHRTAIGETFIISGSFPTTWRQFYGAYEKMLNKEAVIELDDAQMRFEEYRQRKSQSFVQQLRRALANRPELWQHLLNLPPQRWLLEEGLRMLPSSVKSAIKQRYGDLWNPPVELSALGQALYIHDGFWRALYAAKPYARIDKARKQLGYNPAYDLEAGMSRTADWARSTNLLSAGTEKSPVRN